MGRKRQCIRNTRVNGVRPRLEYKIAIRAHTLYARVSIFIAGANRRAATPSFSRFSKIRRHLPARPHHCELFTCPPANLDKCRSNDSRPIDSRASLAVLRCEETGTIPRNVYLLWICRDSSSPIRREQRSASASAKRHRVGDICTRITMLGVFVWLRVLRGFHGTL